MQHSNSRTAVHYRIRQTGEVVSEPVFAEAALRWFYESRTGAWLFERFLNNGFISWLYGKWQERPASRRQIRAFATTYGINLAELELPVDSYPSFNAFFCRRLKPGARPFAEDPAILPAPADGKILVFPHLAAELLLPIKGNTVSLSVLLASEAAARPYSGGTGMVIRLAPYDYHRFHFPDTGRVGMASLIPGRYHSVNPIALAKVSQLYCHNKRAVTWFDSENFGRIAYVEVGALGVGSIVQTYDPGHVRRGAEKGYFQFGGSTLLLLFEPGVVEFAADLIWSSQAGIENSIIAGSAIGKRP
ncbi:MAG: phosphatidylserine decarboxylase [Cyanobacteria bacterium NC_groundwater_1444_Ag_S-0.65um_54_12]|nr:phosphatidylserine decarboxylase [Cyanobacteria bacterium NC_groundwater_1444_Ag_S-0.65um_54_12]